MTPTVMHRDNHVPARPSGAALALSALVFAASAASAQSAAPRPGTLAVRAENPLAVARPDETIALPWAAVLQQLAGAAPGHVRVVDAGAGTELVSQVVDGNGDGRPDELLFQSDFGPREVRAFVIEPAAPARRAESRVHTRHDPPRDDIAWESDRIAFRMYGQGLKKTPSAMSSSGIDVWVKKVRTPIVEKWYAKGHDAYHVDTGEGADFYDVGTTLGAGGTAVWRNDSLYRADNFVSYRILADGPIRTIFELQYDPWNAGGLRVSETKRISIDAGQNLFRQEIVFKAAGTGDVPYAIGVVKRPGMIGLESKAQQWAWLTGWGPVAPKNGGHGELGNAVLLERSRVRDWKETADHYLAVSSARPNEPVVHYVGAGWTDSGDFRDVRDWWTYLDRFAQRLAAPLRVTVGGAAAAAAR